MRVSAVLSLTLLLTVAAFCQGGALYPTAGYVPDSAAAIKIAEAVLAPIYGKKQIDSQAVDLLREAGRELLNG